MDYTIFYKDSFDPSSDWSAGFHWDIFLSAFNQTERVRRVYDAVRATSKQWIVHNEYGFSQSDLPVEPPVHSFPSLLREDDFMHAWGDVQVGVLPRLRLCVDISGFMRPHLIFLLRLLHDSGVRSFDAIYSEPAQYVRGDVTQFAHGDVTAADVRPIAGYEGQHHPTISGSDDLLIIGAGYEHRLMNCVGSAKNGARKFQMLGFPPLQADFYQESVLNASRAAESVSVLNELHPIFAPSRDPFVTAAVLRDALCEQQRKGARNQYLCPLATRPQALGFALYYLYEGRGQPVSIIYPFASRYAPDSALGVAKIWKYAIELPP